MKRCSRCILPDTYPNITFDDKGMCNQCLEHTERAPRGETELSRIVDRFRNQGSDYDCIVGLSGGRDSSYLLHYAVKVLDLRVLAYTIDNGFMPEHTRANIERMTTKKWALRT